jgi:ABC-type transport system substrate-binding protein
MQLHWRSTLGGGPAVRTFFRERASMPLARFAGFYFRVIGAILLAFDREDSMRCSWVFFAVLTIVAAGSAAAENVLRFVGLSGGALTLDAHSYYDSPNRVATEQIYEALLDVDSYLKIVPQLAISWKPLGQTTWEFELRPDVTFQDGTPLAAEDVVFSINRARYGTSDLGHLVNNITASEAVDDHTVRVTTAGPDPLLWLKISHVAIMSKAWAEQHSVTIPADFKARQETYAVRQANGTGPVSGFVVAASASRRSTRPATSSGAPRWPRPSGRTAPA